MLAFAIPFSGYGQLSDSELSTRYFMDYFTLSSGVNFVNVTQNSNEIFGSYRGFQANLTYEKYIGSSYTKPTNSIEFGVSYISKEFASSYNNSQNSLNVYYLSLPINYNTRFLSVFLMKVGGYVSYKLNNLDGFYRNYSSENLLTLPELDYGIHVGTRLELNEISSEVSIPVFIEYNLQYGLVSIEEILPNSFNGTHTINLGVKFPIVVSKK